MPEGGVLFSLPRFRAHKAQLFPLREGEWHAWLPAGVLEVRIWVAREWFQLSGHMGVPSPPEAPGSYPTKTPSDVAAGAGQTRPQEPRRLNPAVTLRFQVFPKTRVSLPYAVDTSTRTHSTQRQTLPPLAIALPLPYYPANSSQKPPTRQLPTPSQIRHNVGRHRQR